MTTLNAIISPAPALVTTVDSTGNLVLQTAGTTALTLNAQQNANFAGSVNSVNTFGFKNRIINGAMVIDQRNAGAAITPTDGQYDVDRFCGRLTQASKFTLQQTTTAPVGFNYSLKATSSSAYSVVSTDFFAIEHWIEGYNCADLGWGTANAKTVTLSFQVYSSLTGTFGGSLRTYAGGYSYPFSYSIPVANTWTTISITVPGATAGTWNTTNSGCIGVAFSLGAGSNYSGTAGSWTGSGLLSATGATSVVGTNGATFYITGVQLEVGSSATGFEYRQIGTEQSLCERYFQKCGLWNGCGNSSTNWLGVLSVRTYMRTTPSIGQTGVLQVSDFYSVDLNQSAPSVSILSSDNSTTELCFWIFNLSGLTGGKYYAGNRANNNTNYITLSAEL